MAKKAKIFKSPKGSRLQIVNPDCAGIDIANGELQVCISTSTGDYLNTTFGTFTSDLHDISALLKEYKVKTVAMESTGVYWIPLFFRLLADGFDVILCDARSTKVFTSKTDVDDAEGIMTLHKYGLLTSCYQPSSCQREVRNLVRLRNSYVEKETECVNELHKELQQANIKLPLVVSDIMGVTGRKIIEAILNGERDPMTLSNLADRRCKTPKEEIAKALQGELTESRMAAIRVIYSTYHFYEEKIAELDIEIEKCIAVYVAENGIPEEELPPMTPSNKREGKNGLNFDIEKYGYRLYGTNLMLHPGVNSSTLLNFIAELGHDFVQKFKTAEKASKWACLVPDNKISGGKVLSSHIPKRKNPIGVLLRNCVNGISKTKGPWANLYHKFKARGGGRYAHTATAHKLFICMFNCVKNRCEYDPEKAFPNQKAALEVKIRTYQKKLREMERKYQEIS